MLRAYHGIMALPPALQILLPLLVLYWTWYWFSSVANGPKLTYFVGLYDDEE
jgi:hypothetical protein